MQQIVILDSTQISDFMTCPMLWHLKHVERLESPHGNKEPIQAGSYGHKMLENYYTNIHLGIQSALAAANGTSSDEFNIPEELKETVRKRFQEYWMRYSALRDIVPITRKKYTIKIAPNGLPIDAFVDEPLVEQGFSYPLLDTKEFLFILEGKVDLIGTYGGQTVFMDHKFQFRERNLYQKRVQFRNYSLALKLNTGIVNYIRFHKKLQDNTFVRDVITLLGWELEWWREELIKIFKHVAKAKVSGTLENNWDACEGKYGYACNFTSSVKHGRLGICENQANTQLVTFIKSSHYQKTPAWTPWELKEKTNV